MQAIRTAYTILAHAAALAFILWLCTGGPLWKGKPAHHPAIKAFAGE